MNKLSLPALKKLTKYKLNTFKMTSTSNYKTTSTRNTTSLDGMTFTPYGRGILLTADDDHPRQEQKYLYGGWWMPSLSGWFFKKSLKSKLLSLGAQSSSSVDTTSASKPSRSSSSSSSSLKGMSFESYGKGLLLTCDPSSQRFGQKYFYGGWWLPSQDGWFFRKSLRSKLLSLGAVSSTETSSSSTESSSSSTEHSPLSGMTFTPYGRGLLLTCSASHSRWSQKYFYGGWWMPAQDGWFFKSNLKSKLVSLGASCGGSEGCCSSGSPSSTQFTDMVVEKYGRGYLLVPSGRHQDEGVKNYFGGWWMPKFDSWFFKSQYLDVLLSHGADHSMFSE